MKIKKVYVIAALHGTEVFGLKILAHIEAMGNPHILTKIGHPEAIAKKRLYLESNLNRSFGADQLPTKESKIAARIMTEIARFQPDLIIDLHTARAPVGKVGIIAADNRALIGLAKRLGMDQVAVMPPSISKPSLIGQFPTTSISLEFGVGYRSDTLAARIAKNIAVLVGEDIAAPSSSNVLPVYLVQRVITRGEEPSERLVNYVYNHKLKGYPFLSAPRIYEDHVGFLAIKKGE